MRISLKLVGLLAAALLLPLAAIAGDIQINTVCYLGTCPPPSGTSDAVQFGQSIGPTTGSTPLTIGTDTYTISWTFSASYDANGTALLINPVVTYTGASPSTTADVIDFNFYQNYYDNSPGSWDGNYTETVPFNFNGTLAGGTSISAQLLYDTQTIGLLGPVTSSTTLAQTTALSGLTAATLSAEYEFVFDIAAGTLTNASLSAPSTNVVPEPSTVLLSLGALAALGFTRLARKRSLAV